VRWIEARSVIVYEQGHQPSRLIAVIIDFTERKRAELVLAERNAQLVLAGRAGRVGTYAYDANKDVIAMRQNTAHYLRKRG